MDQFENNIYTMIWGKNYGFSEVKFIKVQFSAKERKKLGEVQCSEV